MSTQIKCASQGAPITLSDTEPNVFDRIWVGETGDVAVRLKNQSTGSLIFKAVPPGIWLDVRTVLVLVTGTTATSLVGVNFEA